MYHADAEILFPPRVVPMLRNLRGRIWQDLVDRVALQPEGSLDSLAFCLLMIHLDGCLTCYADSYRALQGCTFCAHRAVSRFKGSDGDLITAFETARTDILRWRAGDETPFEISR
jgi:hypothetical protein